MQDIIGKFNLYLVTQKHLSSNTAIGYIYDVDQFADYCKEHTLNLKRVTAKQLKQYLSYLASKKLSDATRYRKVYALKSFFEFYRRRTLANSLIAPQIEQKLPKYLTRDKITLLLDQLNRETGYHAIRNKMIITLLYTSGMRVSELTNLKIHQLYLSDHMIVVYGKGRKHRPVPIPKPVIKQIQHYLDTYRADFTYKKKTLYVFPVKYGDRIEPITRQSVKVILKKIAKKAGIKQPVSPHQLRHSLATHLLMNGANIMQIKKILGHERLEATQIYTHLDMTHKQKEYQKHPRA